MEGLPNRHQVNDFNKTAYIFLALRILRLMFDPRSFLHCYLFFIIPSAFLILWGCFSFTAIW